MKSWIILLFISLFFNGALLSAAVKEKSVFPDSRIWESSRKAVKEHFPDADNVLLREKECYTYEKSGKYRADDELYVKILTEKGRVSLRRLSFYFNTHYNRIQVLQVSVIKPDGKIENVDIPGNSREVIDSSQMASNIYDPASKRLVVSIPRIEVGDILYVRTSDEHFKPRMPGFWSNYSLLQSDWPIVENTIEINAPAALPLRSVALKDPVKGTVSFAQKKVKDRIVYRWHAANVPQVIREPGMPELHTCVQRLLVSTASSWEEVSRWYWQLCRPRLDAVTPAMKARVRELIRGRKSDMEKVRALFQFVSQNIRYMGITPEKEAPGYEPHDVKVTFEQRYGVCRDKAALLVTMLELAGFKAYPVLFMAGDPKDDEIPNGYFNHAVTAVELGKKNYVLMDPTYESTRDLFPAFQADMSYLVAHPQGEKLRRSPLVPASANSTRITTTGKIDEENVLHGESVIELAGVNDIYYRGALSKWPGERKEQFFTGRLRRILPGVRVEELKITPENIRNMSENLKFRFRFSAPASGAEGVQMLRTPELSEVFGIGEAVFQSVSQLTRQYPLKLAATCRTEENISIRLPESCRIEAMPEKTALSVGGKISFKREASLEKKTLKLKREFTVNTLEVSPKEYPALKKLLNVRRNARKVTPIAFRHYRKNSSVQESLKTFPGADSVIESHEITLDVSNSSRWSKREKIRRRILNYAGVKAHSEVKIPFLPGWLEIGSVKASVTSPEGKVRKINSQEINVMDSPRNGAAPRYPAAKVMVLSLPGVAPGSVVELDIQKNYLNRPFFSVQHCFVSGSAPVLTGIFSVCAPEGMYLKKRVTGDVSVTFTEENCGKKRVWRWQVKNLPRLKNETGTPPWQLFLPGVLLSSDDNKSFALALNKALLEKCRRSIPAAEKLIRSQKWSASEKKEQLLVRIRDYIDKNIRKVSLPLGEIPLSALSDAEATLKSGYGNSADRAILLGAILQKLGIKFQFVGASSIGGAHAVIRLFNHDPDPEKLAEEILVYIPELGWYLNDTSRFAAPGAVNAENKLGLDLSSGRLRNIQAAAMKGSARQLAFHVECRNDGSALVRVTESLWGKYFEEGKAFFDTATPVFVKRYFEERATAVSHRSVLKGTPEYDFKNYPGTVRYTLEADSMTEGAGQFRILPLPRYDLLRSTGALPASPDRKLPYWRNEQSSLTLRYNIVPPPGFKAVPVRKERIQEGKYGSAQFTENYTASPKQITIYSRLFLPVELVSVLDFCELESRQMRVSLPEAERVVFAPAGKKSGK